MVDGSNTSHDWQVHTGDVCVFPVGAVEQHSMHLPLATDCMIGEAIARMLAAELGAALLPLQPYGTSAEHAGFRGSVTLRPETLMQIVRDVADEMERQQFRIMLLVNGHGGNFSLVPVARDINRLDRRLKILIVNWWEFCDPAICTSAGDLHSGEFETSVMLALHPDRVGTLRDDRPDAVSHLPLRQGDLTTFGVGHFNPTGAVGTPSVATREKGQSILESARQRMLPLVRDRIDRLRRQPRYCGPGGRAIRPLALEDIPAGLRLATAAGWNQTEDDWRFVVATPERIAKHYLWAVTPVPPSPSDRNTANRPGRRRGISLRQELI